MEQINEERKNELIKMIDEEILKQLKELKHLEERKEQIIERLLELDEQKKRRLAQHPSRLVAEED